MNFKTALKKFWKFVWHDDSVASWIVAFVLAFLIVKFIVYPLIGLAFGTSYPIVAVVSGSMEHEQSFGQWWELNQEWYEESNIYKEDFENFVFKNGFVKGDIIFLKGSEPKDIKVGEVIVFQSTTPYPVIHRVVKVWEEEDVYYFQTKGDHNSRSDPGLLELEISGDRVLGKTLFRIPKLGWVKLIFVEIFKLGGK